MTLKEISVRLFPKVNIGLKTRLFEVFIIFALKFQPDVSDGRK